MNVKRAYVSALGVCVLRAEASEVAIQNYLHFEKKKAAQAIAWMEENYYVTSCNGRQRKILINLDGYKIVFKDYLQTDRLFLRKYEKKLFEMMDLQ